MVQNFTEIPDPSRELLHLYFPGCRSVSENCKNFHPSKIPHYTISYQYSMSVTHPLCCRSVTTNLPLSSSQHFITPSNKSKKNQELHIWCGTVCSMGTFLHHKVPLVGILAGIGEV